MPLQHFGGALSAAVIHVQQVLLCILEDVELEDAQTDSCLCFPILVSNLCFLPFCIQQPI